MIYLNLFMCEVVNCYVDAGSWTLVLEEHPVLSHLSSPCNFFSKSASPMSLSDVHITGYKQDWEHRITAGKD